MYYKYLVYGCIFGQCVPKHSKKCLSSRWLLQKEIISAGWIYKCLAMEALTPKDLRGGGLKQPALLLNTIFICLQVIFLGFQYLTFIGSISWSIRHLVWIGGIFIFCSMASRMALTFDFQLKFFTNQPIGPNYTNFFMVWGP